MLQLMWAYFTWNVSVIGAQRIIIMLLHVKSVDVDDLCALTQTICLFQLWIDIVKFYVMFCAICKILVWCDGNFYGQKQYFFHANLYQKLFDARHEFINELIQLTWHLVSSSYMMWRNFHHVPVQFFPICKDG